MGPLRITLAHTPFSYRDKGEAEKGKQYHYNVVPYRDHACVSAA